MIKKKKSLQREIVADVLRAAIEPEFFNVNEFAVRSGHPWETVKRVVESFALKDALKMAVLPFGRAPAENYQVIYSEHRPQKRVDKKTLLSVLADLVR